MLMIQLLLRRNFVTDDRFLTEKELKGVMRDLGYSNFKEQLQDELEEAIDSLFNYLTGLANDDTPDYVYFRKMIFKLLTIATEDPQAQDPAFFWDDSTVTESQIKRKEEITDQNKLPIHSANGLSSLGNLHMHNSYKTPKLDPEVLVIN